MRRIYLDYAATTPVDPRVFEAMRPYFCEKFGNPSSVHFFGQAAKKAIEGARSQVAALLGAKDEEIVFTSGGTEANNFALFGIAAAHGGPGRHIVTTAIEHHAILEPLHRLEREGWRVTYVNPGPDGIVSSEEVAAAISSETVLVSVMHANNEIGSIQPIKEMAEAARSRGVCFHTDAVQTVGHIPFSVDDLGVDLLSLSAHKFYGPKGVGCLYIRSGTQIAPYLFGGAQERQRRASTENVAGIVGLGKAAELAAAHVSQELKQQGRWRDMLIAGIEKRVAGCHLNGHAVRRLPHNINFSVEGVEGESLVLKLDMLGVACSTSSACMARHFEPSHVLLAIGRPPELCRASVRLTLGRYTREEELERFLDIFPRAVARLRAASPRPAGSRGTAFKSRPRRSRMRALS